MNKAELRRAILAARAALPREEALVACAAVLKAIRALPAWTTAKEVLTFMPVRGEIDITPLLDDLRDRGVRTLLPRCRPGTPGHLDVACLTPDSPLLAGAFGIPEPDPNSCPTLEDFAPDIAIIPGVAFDRTGNRMGFGLGYYDRLLASPQLAHTLRVSPAYALQVLDNIPAEPWDIPVQVICTEHETLWTNR